MYFKTYFTTYLFVCYVNLVVYNSNNNVCYLESSILNFCTSMYFLCRHHQSIFSCCMKYFSLVSYSILCSLKLTYHEVCVKIFYGFALFYQIRLFKFILKGFFKWMVIFYIIKRKLSFEIINFGFLLMWFILKLRLNPSTIPKEKGKNILWYSPIFYLFILKTFQTYLLYLIMLSGFNLNIYSYML